MKRSIGFIGGGRVTKIFLQAFKNKNSTFGKIVVADVNNEVLRNLQQAYPDVIAGSAGEAASLDIVFIALHPPVIIETLGLISRDVRKEAVVVSLAPKISLEKIKMQLPHVTNVARMIPNATSYINEGFNPVTFAPAADKTIKEEILDILKILGVTFEVEEQKLESYAIMSAMLPTYFWFQWRALSEIGEKTGLSGDECRRSIYETLEASLKMMYKSGLSPAEVIDLIPVKPIGENESQIISIYNTKLLGLFEKIKP